MSSRRLAWSTLLAPAARLQEHAIAQNPLQRRAGLADLAVAVGKGGHARVRHLEGPVAAELWERLRLRRERQRRRVGAGSAAAEPTVSLDRVYGVEVTLVDEVSSMAAIGSS